MRPSALAETCATLSSFPATRCAVPLIIHFSKRRPSGERFFQDIRFAVKVLLSKPSFTFIVILTLAIGIGSNIAIFSVIDGVLLRPLEYRDPDRLVQIWDVNRSADDKAGLVAPADFLEWRDQSESFEEMAAYYSTGVNLWSAEEPERVILGVASREYFSILHTKPVLGRFFEPEEETWGNHRVALISYRLWQRHFFSDSAVLNETITLNGHTFEIIGVLPEGFLFSESPLREAQPDVWRPLAFQETWLERDGARWIQVIGRLKSGTSIEQAQGEMTAMAALQEADHPQTNTHHTVRLVPLHEEIVGNYRSTLHLLFGAVGFVLLISCANVGNLLLARAQTRQAEFATRIALGAGRWRLLRQLLSESLVIALFAALFGLLLAQWGMGATGRPCPSYAIFCCRMLSVSSA